MAEGDYNVKAIISAETSDYEKGINKLNKKNSQFSSGVSGIGNLLKKAFVITSVVAVGKAIANVSAEFDKARSSIVKATGATGKQLEGLTKSLNKALVSGVGRPVEEIGKMIGELNTRFDASGNELDNLVKDFHKFAKVTDSEVVESIKSMDDIMDKWNIKTEDATNLMDQFVKASQMSGASVNELMASINSSQSILSQFGFNLTESIGLFGTFEKNGIESANAIVGFRTALSKFSSEGINAGVGLKDIGEKIKNAKTESEALKISLETFGTRGGAEMVKVFRNNSMNIDAFTESLRNAKGVMDETHEASRTVSDAWEDFKATFKGKFFGEGDFGTGLRDFIDSIREKIEQIDFSPLINGLKWVARIVSGVWGKFKELFSKIIDAIGITSEDWENLKDTIWDVANEVYKDFSNAMGILSDLLDGNIELVKLRIYRMGIVWKKRMVDLVNWFIEKFRSLFDWFVELWKGFLEVLSDIGVIDMSPELQNLTSDDVIESTKKYSEELAELDKQIQKLYKKKSGRNMLEDLDDLAKSESKAKKSTRELGGAIDDLGDSSDETNDKTKTWAEDIDKLSNSIKNEMKSIGENLFTDTFEKIGQSITDASVSWEDFKDSAVSALSDVLLAIGKQLMAMGSAKIVTKDYSDAIIAFSAGAAAIAGAGMLKGILNVSKSIEDSVSSLKKFKKTIEEILEGISDVKTMFEGIKSIVSSVNPILESISETQKKINLLSTATWFKTTTNAGSEHEIKWYKDIEGNIYRNNQVIQSAIQLNIELRDLNSELALAYKSISDAIDEYNQTLLDSIEEERYIIQNYEIMFNSLISYQNMMKMFSSENEQVYSELSKIYEKYRDILKNTQLLELETVRETNYSDLLKTGTELGETLMSSIVDGANKSNFLQSMKSYIREQLIKFTIYSEKFTEKLAEIGTKISESIVSGLGLSSVKDELSSIYDEISEETLKVEELLNDVFGNISETIFETIEDIKDGMSEIGSSIAENLIESLSEGLSQSDFLESMYKYIRNMIIQTVVYTESMKSEIESIGKTIADGLKNGFTETSLSEIRRDLSYIFYSTSQKMSSIDNLLENVFSGYASGTENATRGLHIVGESGPELVRFRGGEEVLNATDTQKALEGMGGTTIHQNVTFNNLKDTTAFEMLQQLQRYNREMAINSIM